MKVIAKYDESNHIYEEENKEYDEKIDNDMYDFFKNEVDLYIKRYVDYPVQLEARNSTWDKRTGYTIVDNISKLMSKLFSFSNCSIKFIEDKDELYFNTANSDVPCGFNIYVTKYIEEEK